MAEEAGKKKGSSMEMIIALVILTIIGGGGGAVFAHLSQDTGEKPAKQEKAKKADKKNKKEAKAKAAEDEEMASQPKIVPLPPIVANLEAPESRWVRFEASLLVVGGDDPVNLEMRHRVAQDIMARIRQFKISEIEGADGLLNLRSDLTELARIRTEGKALDLIINGLIVE